MTTTAPRAKPRQRTPLARLEDEVFFNALRTADYLLWGEIEVLRTAHLTFPQYNVLRILRGAEPDGLTCREISERMVTRDSDITRLLDRLEARDLVARVRHLQDRRVIVQRITKPGFELLQQLDEPVERVHHDQLKHLSRTQLRSLSQLLELARGGRK